MISRTSIRGLHRRSPAEDQGHCKHFCESLRFSMHEAPSTLIPVQYVVDLSENDMPDTVRFQLPSHVGARYGAPPSSVLYQGTAHRARLCVTVDVEMPATIYNVNSPTHPIEHIPISSHSVSVDHFARVQFASDTFLDKDFLLEVQAPGHDKPRCFSESLSNGNRSTTALALTMVPQFELPALTQEYIFLIDRSGSMAGIKITTAKQALVFLLKTLPYNLYNNTTFNIFSFGYCFSSLWSQSEEYSPANVNWAVCDSDTLMI